MLVRGRKHLTVSNHAAEGMYAERRAISIEEIALVIDAPDHDDGNQAWKRIGPRTVIVYYDETEDEVHVRSVSATRRRLAS